MDYKEIEQMTAEEFYEYTEGVGGPIETIEGPGVFAVLFDEPEHWKLMWRNGKAHYVRVRPTSGL